MRVHNSYRMNTLFCVQYDVYVTAQKKEKKKKNKQTEIFLCKREDIRIMYDKQLTILTHCTSQAAAKSLNAQFYIRRKH